MILPFLGKSPLPSSSSSVPSSNAETSRSPSSQSDWFTHGGNTIGPLPSTLSLGDYNKLLVDTKRLMSTHQLPYVAKLTTDSSGEESDRTQLTSTYANNEDSSTDTLKKSSTGQCTSPSTKPLCAEQEEATNSSSNSQTPQQPTYTTSHSTGGQFNMTNQLPPLSPPSAKKQIISAPKAETKENVNETPSLASQSLIVNGSKCQPTSNIQSRPGFLSANFPKPQPMDQLQTSPVPYSRPSSKSSPVSSSPKPFSPNVFKPIANSSPFPSSTTTAPTRNNITPSPKKLEGTESTTTAPKRLQPLLPDHKQLLRSDGADKNLEKGVFGNDTRKDMQNNDQGTQNKDQTGINNLLTEVDQRIRFSLDIASVPQSSKGEYLPKDVNAFPKESLMKDVSSDDTAQNMKDDLSQVKKDINDIRNELSAAKQGLENGKQPLLVSIQKKR